MLIVSDLIDYKLTLGAPSSAISAGIGKTISSAVPVPLPDFLPIGRVLTASFFVIIGSSSSVGFKILIRKFLSLIYIPNYVLK